MAVSPETLAKIKNAPISLIVKEEGGFLKRIGREHITHCLWHKDTNPSLTINDDKGFVFCHVCQQHNDAIGYVRQKHGFSFRDACERICSILNVTCLYVDEDSEAFAERKREINRELEKVSKLQESYRKALVENADICIPFLQERSILPETSRSFGLGFDPVEQRLTIPIHNYKGEQVGFTARAISSDGKPKYKNTENNIVFNKSELVFNEHRASSAIREADSCVFVEGHIDVISLWQAGVKNVVALQGTSSPSELIIQRLKNKTKRFILAMDGDEGGNIAIARFIDSIQDDALNGIIDIKIASFPAGEDPDSYIKNGGNIFSVIGNAMPWMDWILDKWLADLDFQDSTKFNKVEKQIKDLFSKISSPALRAHYYDKASIRLAQNKQGLAAQIAKAFHQERVTQASKNVWTKPNAMYTRKLIEKRMLRLYLHRPDFRWVLKPLMDKLYFANMIWLWNRVKEVEELQQDIDLLTALSAILAVAENHYVQQLRSILVPTINIEDDESSISHIEDVMIKAFEMQAE